MGFMNKLGKAAAKLKEAGESFKQYNERLEDEKIEKKKQELETLKKKTIKKVELAKIQEEIDELKKFEKQW